MTSESVIRTALERYEKPLVAYAAGIAGDLGSARDAVQETFLRLSRQDVVALEPRLAPWLFFVCRNCALDHRRKVVRFADSNWLARRSCCVSWRGQRSLPI
ncbi:MAG: sigma factor [Chthoniobacterales bacterium]